MPYHVIKSGRGYYVENKENGRRYSNSPIPKSHAMAQMRAIYANENGYKLSPKKRAFYAKHSKNRSRKRSLKYRRSRK